MTANQPSTSSSLTSYQRYRAALLPLHHKIIDAYVDHTILEKAARALKLGGNRRLLLDSENDMSVLMDYGLYEISTGGQNLVQRYKAEKSEQSDIERELLAAMVKSQTGLFQVQDKNAQKAQVVMQELTGERRQITLTDINFSQTLLREYILFFRMIELSNVTMTSGVAFSFQISAKERLLRRWRQWSTAERYTGYFQLSKRHGVETHYR